MHIANQKLWQQIANRYPRHFNNAKVIECGSLDTNGTVRKLFTNNQEYIGVDWREGPRVDHVYFIHDLPWQARFNTVISSSLLEHDPYWIKTLKKMTELLTHDGGLFLSWGAALNPPHCTEHADDGCFHSLPAKKVVDALIMHNMYIQEFGYEANLPDVHEGDFASKDGFGEVYLVAFPQPGLFVDGLQHIEDFVPEDAIDLTDEEIAQLCD